MTVLFKGIYMSFEDLNLLYKSQVKWWGTKGYTDAEHVLHALEQLKSN